jgi:hypothetical protein
VGPDPGRSGVHEEGERFFTIFWIAMIPVSILTGWIESVTYVAALSLWALVSGHWSAYQAARTEVLQQGAADEVEEKLLKDTNIEPIE